MTRTEPHYGDPDPTEPTVLVYTAPGAPDPGLVHGAASAGAVGVLVLDGLDDNARRYALAEIADTAPQDRSCGVRFDPRDSTVLAEVLDAAAHAPLHIVVLGHDASNEALSDVTPFSDEIARLRYAGLRVLVEVADEASAANAVQAGADGLIAYLPNGPLAIPKELVPKLVGAHHNVVYARAAAGPSTAHALAIDGATGCVLDVDAWLIGAPGTHAATRQAARDHPGHHRAETTATRHEDLASLIGALSKALETGHAKHLQHRASHWVAPRIAPGLAASSARRGPSIDVATSIRHRPTSTDAPATEPAPAVASAQTTIDASTPPTRSDPPNAASPLSPMTAADPPPSDDAPKTMTAPHIDATSTTRGPSTEPTDTQNDATYYDLDEGIAIVGYGCVLPQAPNVDSFWNNVLEGRDCIMEVPADRWDPRLFYDPDGKDATTYTKIGGFVTDIPFDPLAFRIPPKVAQSLDGVQRMTLAATREALLKSGYLDEKLRPVRAFDPERTAVILGNAMGGELQRIVTRRIAAPYVLDRLHQTPSFQQLPVAEQQRLSDEFMARYLDGLPEVTEDTMPGELSNIVSGRIANVFHFMGKNHTVDAACASSFAALDAAVKGLLDKEFDLVVTGGADRSMDIDTYAKFCKIGALSKSGSTPFDRRADGFVMGEGAAVFVLKRLSDAIKDKDIVHAVIRGIGASSDGKGKGITAPNKKGQILAVKRAIERGNVPPDTIQYIEAHGTSTKVGDVVEVESLAEALQDAGFGPKSVALGSVKSQIGHLKSAAGAAGMLKTVLALEHATLPPSINFQDPNPNIDWENGPFRVVTRPEPWPANRSGFPRRAGVSSFGFGGTNFHILLEEFVPEIHTNKAMRAGTAQRIGTRHVDLARHDVEIPAAGAPMPNAQAESPAVTASTTDIKQLLADRAGLEGEPLIVGAEDRAALLRRVEEVARTFPDTQAFEMTGVGPRLKDLVYEHNLAGVKAPVRAGFVVKDAANVREQARFAMECAQDPKKAKIAHVKGVFFGEGLPRGKIAFLFPGQGSQYAEMLFDLYEKYAIVHDTFVEADSIMEPLIGQRLTPIIFPSYKVSDPDDRSRALAEAEEALRQTEICQPAVLTADIAIWRLLRSLGIEPDVVAGHSLGEYAALVAAGILRFEDALLAVSARGKEMANVDVPDLGKMASITAPFEVVESVLGECQEYVIPANKNCPAMTVIAGSSRGLDEAVAKFAERGIQAQPIPVSAAFHSDIVAPASGPLRRVLERVSIHPAKVPIYANVTGQPYETSLDAPAFREYVLDMLAKQVASPVEWTNIIEAMHAEGVTTFIEVGPKRALSGFVSNILEGRDFVPITTNHPKKGGIHHINEAYAILAAMGHRPKVKHPEARAHYTPDHLRPLAGLQPQAPSTTTTGTTDQPGIVTIQPRGVQGAATRDAEDAGIVISGASLGLPGRARNLFDDHNLEALFNGDNFIDPLTLDERAAIADKNIVRLTKRGDGTAGFETIDDIEKVIRLAARIGRFDLDEEYGIDGEFAETFDITTKMAIAAAIEALKDAGIPLVRTYAQTTTGSHLPKDWALPEPLQDDTGIIFASAFPGYDNMVDEVSRHVAQRYAGNTRDALRTMHSKLAAQVTDPELRRRLEGWLDEAFADVSGTSDEDVYTFNRKFLFNVLSMGHAQLAQLIKAKGPNVQLNAACSSTTLAVAVAEDWIRAGRCKRVIVVGADNVTSDNMMEWIGAGFLASGAATTEADVSKAALPFDRRRHGMIIGAGACGLVIERRQDVRARGMDGLVEVLGTQVANSAFHGSRLDVAHIKKQMEQLLARVESSQGIHRGDMARELVFMSHETYTPARGGSGSAEVESLRAAFADEAKHILVANTKGYTGHPMGAGIEDAVAVKCLQYDRVPPVANLSETDPEFADLNFARGGSFAARYTLRLAAGFGSQIAFWLGRALTKGDQRINDDARHEAWLAHVSGLKDPALEIVNKTLRIKDQGPPGRRKAPIASAAADDTATLPESGSPPEPQDRPMPLPTMPSTTGTEPGPAPTPTRTAPELPITATTGTPDEAPVLREITRLVAAKTGYPDDMLEPELDMEADLGIDTVKQAELFGEIRESYGLPPEEGLQIKDYPTLAKVAKYVVSRHDTSAQQTVPSSTPTQQDSAPRPSPSTAPPPSASPVFGTPPASRPSPASPASATAPAPTTRTSAPSETLPAIVALLAEQTGYPADMLEPDLDMEADLGIDTVKQAELFGEIREKYGLPLDESLQIKDLPTIRHIADYVAKRVDGSTVPVPTTTGQAEHAAPAEPATASAPIMSQTARPHPVADAPPAMADTPGSDDVLPGIIALLADKTGYPADMLEPDLDLEADLGIDTVKQAELFGEIRRLHGLPLDESLQIKDLPTIQHIARYVSEQTASQPTADAAPPKHVRSDRQPVHAPSAHPEPAQAGAKTVGPPEAAHASDRPAKEAAVPAPASSPTAPTAMPFFDDGAPTIGGPSVPTRTPAGARLATTTPTTGPSNSATVATNGAACASNELDDGAPIMADASRTARPTAPEPTSKAAAAPPAATSQSRLDRPVPGPEKNSAKDDAEATPLGAASATPDDALARITDIIAAKTGYPAEMLEPALDMEADLGIDTVKQAELFAEVREAFGIELPEGLQISDYPTIEKVAGFVIEHRGAAKAAPKSAAVATSVAPTTRTGPSAPARPATDSTTDPERSAHEEDGYRGPIRATSTQAATATGTTTEDTDAWQSAPIIRRVVVPRDAPLDNRRERAAVWQGPIIVTQDRVGWTDSIVRALAEAGATPVVLGHEEPAQDLPGYFASVDLADAEAVAVRVHEVHDRIGPIGGIIHLASLTEQRLPTDPRAFLQATRAQVKSLYAVARSAFDDLRAAHGAPIVTLTRMGGTFTMPDADGILRSDIHFNPLDGGSAGLTKSLAKELPDAHVRVIDLAQTIGPHDAARIVMTELHHAPERVEVGYPEHHRRIVLDVVARPVPRFETLRLGGEDHILVTGGAQGVTAAVIEGLLDALPHERRPAVTLVGRTALPSDIVELAALDAAGLAARKQALLAEMRQRQERVTPVELERAWSKTGKAIEVQQTIERMRQRSPRINYLVADVTDQASMREAVATAHETFGPITGVLHGAGIERSKALPDKDPVQFDAVFDPKVLGMHNLVVAANQEPLRFVALMGSVAGRFGNMAQADYSAANDLAARYAVALGRTRGCRGFAIDWSAWGEVGMATRGGIMTIMEAAKVTPIPVQEGVARFVEELLQGDAHPEVVVGGALGAIDADTQVSANTLQPAVPSAAAPDGIKRPLVDGFAIIDPARYAVAVRTFSLERDHYLEDHRVDGVPYLPGVMGVEAFAQAADALLNEYERDQGYAFCGAEDVSFQIPVKLLRDQALPVRIVAERLGDAPSVPEKMPGLIVADDDDAELLSPNAPVEPAPDPMPEARFRCRIESDFVGPDGRILGPPRTHFTGTVRFAPRTEAPRHEGALPIQPGRGTPVADKGTIYATFFHGPTFQVLDGVQHLGDSVAAAIARFEHDALFADEPRPDFHSAPMLRESGFQAAGLWALATAGRMSLPAAIQRIDHYGQSDEAPPGTSLVVMARHERDVDDQYADYSVEAYTPEGVLVDRMEGYRMIRTGDGSLPLQRGDGDDRDDAPSGDGGDSRARAQAASDATSTTPGQTGRPAAEGPSPADLTPTEHSDQGDWDLYASAHEILLETCVNRLDGNTWRADVRRVAERIDDDAWLAQAVGDDAARRVRRMNVAKRQREHAAGILAARHAAHSWLSARGQATRLADVAIEPDAETRAPRVRIRTETDRGWTDADVGVTISHCGPHALATAFDAKQQGPHAEGIDIERIEARSDGFHDIAFSAIEQGSIRRLAKVLPSDARHVNAVAEYATRYWTVKEAVAKSLGTGLAMRLHDVQVDVTGPAVEQDGAISVSVAPRLLDQVGLPRATYWRVRSHRFDQDHVVAHARRVLPPRAQSPDD